VTQAVEMRLSDLERTTLLKDARVRTLQETLQQQETETLRLKQAIAESSREVAAAQSRVMAAERRAHDCNEQAHRRALDIRLQQRSDLTHLVARAEEAEASANVRQPALACDVQCVCIAVVQWRGACMSSTHHALRHLWTLNYNCAVMQVAQHQLADTKDALQRSATTVTQLRAEVEQCQSLLNQSKQAAQAQAADAAQSRAAVEQQLVDSQAEVKQRCIQLQVLTDTVEALQSASDDERDQRIVNLTAQLVTASINEEALQRRCQTLGDTNARLTAECVSARYSQQRAEAAHAAVLKAQAVLKQKCERLKTDLSESQADAKSSEASAQKAVSRANAASVQRDAAVCELAGAQDALKSAAARHAEQLEQERTAARKAACMHSVLGHTGAAEPRYMQDVRSALEALQQAIKHGGANGA
jgi:chromosome segregation ATPase